MYKKIPQNMSFIFTDIIKYAYALFVFLDIKWSTIEAQLSKIIDAETIMKVIVIEVLGNKSEHEICHGGNAKH